MEQVLDDAAPLVNWHPARGTTSHRVSGALGRSAAGALGGARPVRLALSIGPGLHSLGTWNTPNLAFKAVTAHATGHHLERRMCPWELPRTPREPLGVLRELSRSHLDLLKVFERLLNPLLNISFANPFAQAPETELKVLFAITF